MLHLELWILDLWNVVLQGNREDKIARVLECIGEKRIFINNILCGKANWTGHIMRINCPLYDAIEVQMTEVKGEGKRRTQLHELKDEAEDRNRWKRQFINRK